MSDEREPTQPSPPPSEPKPAPKPDQKPTEQQTSPFPKAPIESLPLSDPRRGDGINLSDE